MGEEGETIKTRYTVNNNTPLPRIPAIQRSLQQDIVRRLPIVARARPPFLIIMRRRTT